MKNKNFLQFIKYTIVGGTVAVFDIAFVYFLVEKLNVFYLSAVVISFVFAAGINFVFQKIFTFKCGSKKYFSQFSKFCLIAIFGVLINIAVVFVAVEYFEIWYLLGKILAAGIAFIWNFFANKFFTFKR